MATYPISFLVLHEALFMQGSNLGSKINATQKKVKMHLDDQRGLIWVFFNGKRTAVSLSNMVSCDFLEVPEDIMRLEAPAEAKRGPGRPKQDETPIPTVPYDAHREAVRRASMEANLVKPNPNVTSDHMIQEARNQAMGMKFPGVSKAQVATAHEVGEQTLQPTSKKKIMSHEELKTQLATEKG